MRNGLAALDLVKPFADGGQKFHALGNGIKTGIIRQTLNRIQNQLFVAHGSKDDTDRRTLQARSRGRGEQRTVSPKIFDELPLPGGEGRTKNAE